MMTTRFETGQTSHIGDRTENQDRSALVEDDDGVLMAVADGMGGHARGDLAAQAFIDVVTRRFRNRQDLEDPQQFLKDCFYAAQRLIIAAGETQDPPVRPLTTGVICLVQGDTAHWAHVGDSRMYLLRDGKIRMRTTDHTRVAELVEAGIISAQQARVHPLRNQVSQCLGGDPGSAIPTVSPSVYLQDGDVLLLCTDGLWSAVPESRLLGLQREAGLVVELESIASAAEWASYPKSDNVTAVALRWTDSQCPGPVVSDDPAPERAVEIDPVEQAIADIEHALDEYGAELDEERGK